MAFTYTTLKTAVQDYLQTDETTFVDNLPVIVKQAEDRILKSIQLPDFRKNATGSFTIGDQYLATPTDFLAPYSITVGATAAATSSQRAMLFKNVNFIREAYPDPTVQGRPKHYSIFNDDFFIVAPTPDVAYLAEIHYFHRPASIVDAGTSWLGDNAESTLFSACLLEAYIFLKGDDNLLKVYSTRYDDALNKLAALAEIRNKTDEFRNG